MNRCWLGCVLGFVWVVVDRLEADFMLVEWPGGEVSAVPWVVVDGEVKEGDRFKVSFELPGVVSMKPGVVQKDKCK